MKVEHVGEARWLASLMDASVAFDVDRHWFGQAVRRDGWSCRDRAVPWHVIYVAIAGRSVGQAGETDITLEPGMVLWLPPQCMHSMRWTPTFHYAELWVTLRRRARQLSPWPEPRRWGVGVNIQPWIDRAADELHSVQPRGEVWLRAIVAAMAVKLFSATMLGQAPHVGLTALQRANLHQYVQAHIGDGLTAADLAAHIGLERDYFARLFRRSFGCPPRTWLLRERVRNAAHLLVESDLPVYAIADAMGYADVAQFSRQFKRVTGRSPRTFRREAPAHAATDRTHH
ncbi:MAG: AraC family transcriptional regulator [Phycisphaeraceae bacterium]